MSGKPIFSKNKTFDSRTILASVVFFIMLLGLGIPIWWYTTAVHRANLPDLNTLDSTLENPRIHITYKSAEDSPTLSEKLKYLETAVQDKFSCDIILVHQKLNEKEIDVLKLANSVESIDAHLHKIGTDSASSKGLIFMDIPNNFLTPWEAVFGDYNHIYISSETSLEALVKVFQIITKPLEKFKQGHDKSSKLHHSSEYNVLITVATSQPEPKWNIASLVDNYLDRFSQKLAYFANLTILTQMIYVGDGNIRADYRADSKSYTLDEDQVASLINALEPKLGTHLSEKPTLHWVFYLPSIQQSPIDIQFRSASVTNNAVRSPRWNGGGLQIINQNDKEETSAGMLIGQLRSALGIPNYEYSNSQVRMLNRSQSGIADWELESIIIQRIFHCLNQASSTLKSLYQLLSQIENIVVSEAVRDEIVTSLQMNAHSKVTLFKGDVHEAYKFAQISLDCAEKAFFDPSLLALLYFPDDQKYAIYIPLFLPVGIPVVMSLRTVIQYFMSRAKQSV